MITVMAWALTAIPAAAGTGYVMLAWWRYNNLTKQTIIFELMDGTSMQGVIYRRTLKTMYLVSSKLFAPDGRRADLPGIIAVPRENVLYMQIVPTDLGSYADHLEPHDLNEG